MMHRIVVVVPAYNAADSLATLIAELERSYPHISVLVVDDGSTDRTGEVIRVHGAALISHERNLGKGAALKSGFAYALAHEFDAVITMDADMQHDPAEVQLFLEEFLDDHTVLIGVRRWSGDMPFSRRISNSLSTFVASIFAGSRIADSQCGFRLIPTRVLRSLELDSRHYDLEPELIIRAARAGFKIRGIAISTIYNDSVSSIHPLRDTLRFLKLLLKSLLW